MKRLLLVVSVLILGGCVVYPGYYGYDDYPYYGYNSYPVGYVAPGIGLNFSNYHGHSFRGGWHGGHGWSGGHSGGWRR